MKRIFSVLLILMLLCPAALAALDLSRMGISDLIRMRKEIDDALWASKDWQSVTVPMGVYEIGVDIPEGHWTIEALKFSSITWGTGTDEYSAQIPYSEIIDDASILSGDSVSWDLKAGTFLCIDYGSVNFTPYAGANFKFNW